MVSTAVLRVTFQAVGLHGFMNTSIIRNMTPQIITLWEQGDAQAREHVERYLDLLAVPGNILTIVDPDLLVIGEGCQISLRLRNSCPGVCPDIYCRSPACRALSVRDTGTQEACAEPHSFISPISLRGYYAVASPWSTQPFSQK